MTLGIGLHSCEQPSGFASQSKAMVIARVLLLALVPVSISTLTGLAQQPRQIGPRSKDIAWVKYEISGISYEVALEWVMGNETGSNSKKVVFVYLDSKDFARDNLLRVFGHISSKIPQPTVLNITLLTDRDSLKRRVEDYAGWMMSNETPYTRLTMKSDTCCPEHFSGAQFDRYANEGKFVICSDGKASEITVVYGDRNRN